MRVRCIALLDEVSGTPDAESNWLTIGREYVVLSIHMLPGGKVNFLILSDDNEIPVLLESSQFIITSGALPESWVVAVDLNGCLVFSPAAWLRAGFWEDYHNEDQDAEETFVKYVSEIVQFSTEG